MNKLERQRLINNNLRVYVESHSKHNTLEGFNVGNTVAHELKKFEIAFNCKRMGLEVLLEPKLKNCCGRPDVLVLDVFPPVVYEVVCSEKEESLIRKKEKYGDVRIVVVRV